MIDVAPARLAPLIVTFVIYGAALPAGPVAGVKFVIVGGKMTVKLAALDTVPPVVVTAMGPVVAPAGAVAVI